MVYSTSKTSDLNNDGKVDTKDLLLLLGRRAAWQQREGWADLEASDLNSDGKIDVKDLLLFLPHLNK